MEMSFALWNILSELKKEYEFVELSHSLNNDTPIWSGMPDGVVELNKTAFDWGNPMLDCLIETYKFPGQFGTHVDFPGHFIKGMPLSETFGTESMFYPLVVIDITEKVKKDREYAATAEDVEAWEKKYGNIPDGAFVALRTDISKAWPDNETMSGVDKDGGEHFPGWSLDALKYIYETRKANANGHEALDTDASKETIKAGDLACERYVLRQGKMQVEVMQNLDKVAEAGAIVIVTWPRIEKATGLPARVIAITPKKK